MISKESLDESFVLLRVLVADSGSSVNDGLTALLSEIDGISVFGCAQEPDKLLALVGSLGPDVVILDTRNAEPPGRGLMARLKSLAHAPILIALCEGGPPPIREAALAGGADHALLRTDSEELLRLLARIGKNRSRAC